MRKFFPAASLYAGVILLFFSCTPAIPRYRQISSAGSFYLPKYVKEEAYTQEIFARGAYSAGGNFSLTDMMIGVSYIRERHVAAIAGGGYLGNINITGFPELAGNKKFHGLFFAGEIAHRTGDPSSAEIRPGLRFSATYEDGEYAGFRKEGDEQNLFYNMNPDNYSLSISPTFEFIAKKDHIQGGLQVYPGLNFTTDGPLNAHFNIALHLSYRRFTGVLQASTDGGSILTSGLYYRLPVW